MVGCMIYITANSFADAPSKLMQPDLMACANIYNLEKNAIWLMIVSS